MSVPAARVTETANVETPAPRVAPLPAREPPPQLSAREMSKRFGNLTALEDVSFLLKPGSVHALLGENGAGKSTLVKCIMGFYKADRGRVLVGDSEVHVSSPKHARALGIGMVYQHFTLVENMTVAENLVLARAQLPAILDWKAEHAAIDAFMDRMPFRISPRRGVRQLAAGEKQKLEILKQLYLDSRIIILDEPTSVLTPQEADDVLGMLRGMARAGAISVAMITHKFREVQAFADEVTVLRRGKLAGRGKASELSTRELAEMMVGSEPPRASLTRSARTERAPARLELIDLHAEDDIGLPVLEGVTLQVSPGEIVGIAGVSGNGQDELVEVLAGQRTATRGELRVGGARYTPVRAETRRERVRLLPEAPLRNACVAQMSVAENMAFRDFDVKPYCKGGWLLDKRRMQQRARAAIAEYGIKTPSAHTAIGALSGGNVQRAVLARELSEDAAVLIAANPCFGLDFAAVSEIHTRLVRAREAGAAVLLVSADLDEIFALSDRILVMSEGRIVHECTAADANMSEIGQHMAGHAQAVDVSGVKSID
ncbi:MAG TPA: ABC transporter ATP-binding protein [Polyangiaceae bacterium]|nr:ABC transporter ATP-binding protein [Polyangiaceae bacterium]